MLVLRIAEEYHQAPHEVANWPVTWWFRALAERGARMAAEEVKQARKELEKEDQWHTV